MPGMQWARLQVDLNIRLRRGAWYRIAELGPLHAVVDVLGQSIRVPAAFLQIVETPPRRWTVVQSPSHAARMPANWGDRYAVCPNCRERQPITGRRPTMQCGRCKRVSEVAWNESYAPAL